MNTTQQRMAAIFNEWARRYAENPQEFADILDADGKARTDYGECCALYFAKIASEMDAAGLLPHPKAGEEAVTMPEATLTKHYDKNGMVLLVVFHHTDGTVTKTGDWNAENLPTTPPVVMEMTDSPGTFAFFCPGCGFEHAFFTTPAWPDGRMRPVSHFNGDHWKSTVVEEILANDQDDSRCRLHLIDGNAVFSQDCFHERRGQTLPLQPF